MSLLLALEAHLLLLLEKSVMSEQHMRHYNGPLGVPLLLLLLLLKAIIATLEIWVLGKVVIITKKQVMLIENYIKQSFQQ
jgi:hypothetical protein